MSLLSGQILKTEINQHLKVDSVESTMALLEKSSEGRVTAATAMNKVKAIIYKA